MPAQPLGTEPKNPPDEPTFYQSAQRIRTAGCALSKDGYIRCRVADSSVSFGRCGLDSALNDIRWNGHHPVCHSSETSSDKDGHSTAAKGLLEDFKHPKVCHRAVQYKAQCLACESQVPYLPRLLTPQYRLPSLLTREHRAAKLLPILGTTTEYRLPSAVVLRNQWSLCT